MDLTIWVAAISAIGGGVAAWFTRSALAPRDLRHAEALGKQIALMEGGSNERIQAQEYHDELVVKWTMDKALKVSDPKPSNWIVVINTVGAATAAAGYLLFLSGLIANTVDVTAVVWGIGLLTAGVVVLSCGIILKDKRDAKIGETVASVRAAAGLRPALRQELDMTLKAVAQRSAEQIDPLLYAESPIGKRRLSSSVKVEDVPPKCSDSPANVTPPVATAP